LTTIFSITTQTPQEAEKISFKITEDVLGNLFGTFRWVLISAPTKVPLIAFVRTRDIYFLFFIFLDIYYSLDKGVEM
jgi:hypothetical protein